MSFASCQITCWVPRWRPLGPATPSPVVVDSKVQIADSLDNMGWEAARDLAEAEYEEGGAGIQLQGARCRGPVLVSKALES